MSLFRIISTRNLVLMSIVLLPFDQLFSSAFPNFPVSPFRVLTILIGISIFRYNISGFGEFKNIIVLFYIYCCLSFISVFWSEDMVRSLIYTFQIILLIFYSIVSISELIKDKNSFQKISFFGALVGGAISLLSLLGFFSDRDLTLDTRISFADIGVNAIAISIGFMFILGVCNIFLKKQNTILKLLIILSCAIMFYFLIRTGTRSGIFGVMASLIAAYMFAFKLNYINLFKFLVLGIILYFSFSFFTQNYLGDQLFERVFSINAEDIEGNSRNYLWEAAIEWFSFNIWGTGAGNEATAYNYYGYEIKEAHNVFFSSLLQLGFLGFTLIVMTQVIFIVNLIKVKSPILKFSVLSLFFFLLMQMMKGSFLQTRLFWIPIVIIITTALLDEKNKRSKYV